MKRTILTRILLLFLVVEIPIAIISYISIETINHRLEAEILSSLETEASQFAEKLNFAGYTRVPAVEGVGQYAVRGSIVDVFTPTESMPIRIELFGDDIDSINIFD